MQLVVTPSILRVGSAAVRYANHYVKEPELRRVMTYWPERLDAVGATEQFLPFSADDEYVFGFAANEVNGLVVLTATTRDGLGFDDSEEDVVQHMLSAKHEVARKPKPFTTCDRFELLNALARLLPEFG